MINREYKNPKIVWHCAFIRIMYIITLVVGLLAFLIGVITAESLDDISLSLWVYCFMISVPSCGIALFDLKETKTLNESLYALSILFALSCFILQLITFSLPGFIFILYEIIALSVIIYRTINIPTNIEASVSSIKKYNLTVVRLWKILFATIIGGILFVSFLFVIISYFVVLSEEALFSAGEIVLTIIIGLLMVSPPIAANISCMKIYKLMKTEYNETVPQEPNATAEQAIQEYEETKTQPLTAPQNKKKSKLKLIWESLLTDDQEDYTLMKKQIEEQQEQKEAEKNKNFCKKMLSRCGMRFFVKYYDILKTWAIPDIMDEISENYTEDSKRERAECAQRIFSKNLQQVALGLIADDIHGIDEKTRLAAYEIIEKEKQQIEREEQNSSIGKTLE